MGERDIVRVDWIDTSGQARWHDRMATKKNLRPCHCRTFGEVVEEVEDYIMVAGSVDDTNDNVDDVECIPRAAIQKVTVLKKARKQPE